MEIKVIVLISDYYEESVIQVYGIFCRIVQKKTCLYDLHYEINIK
jgi:hypothetical protein